jgi:hypothetical protein
MRTLLVAVVVVLVGCTSVRQHAENAYSKGRYREAAELYDQLLQKTPDDAAAKSRRLDARRMVLREMMIAVQGSRRANRRAAAIEALGELLAQREAWTMADDGSLGAALSIEVAAAGNDIEIEIDQLAHATGPLTAEHKLAGYSRLFAHGVFGGRGRAIRERAADVGRADCLMLAKDTSADASSWSWLVARYCDHWSARVEVPRGVRSELRVGLAVDGAIDGLGGAEADAFRGALATAFVASAWYADNGTGTAHATVSGSIAATFTQRPVALSADWVEQVPYTDYVTESESYQEPYDDTETYTEQVPYTEWKDGAATTVYRSETKTRTVTKYRTAWRDVQKAVTRYRDVPHVFSYQAIEHAARYSSSLAITLDRDGSALTDAVATISRDDVATGIEHDVTFEAAGVHPERPNLPSRGELIAGERQRLAQRLVATLDARYTAKFCTTQVYSRDAAAACAYVGLAAAPAGVHATLRGAFGADEPLLAAVLAR